MYVCLKIVRLTDSARARFLTYDKKRTCVCSFLQRGQYTIINKWKWPELLIDVWRFLFVGVLCTDDNEFQIDLTNWLDIINLFMSFLQRSSYIIKNKTALLEKKLRILTILQTYKSVQASKNYGKTKQISSPFQIFHYFF